MQTFSTGSVVMMDILEKFALFSKAIQTRNSIIQKTDKLIKHTKKALEIRNNIPGNNEEQVASLIHSNKFKCTPFEFENNNKFNALLTEKLLDSA